MSTLNLENGNTSEKKEQLKVLGRFLYIVWLITALLLFYIVPDYGPSALTWRLVSGIGYLLLAAVAIGAGIYQKQDKSSIMYWLLGAMVLFIGAGMLISYSKDAALDGPATITLNAASVSRHTGGIKAHITTYKLEGWNAGQHYSFNISKLPRSQRELLARNDGQVTITYYPNSRVIVDFEYTVDPNSDGSYHASDIHTYNAEQTRNMIEDLATNKGSGITAVFPNSVASDTDAYAASSSDETNTQQNELDELLANSTLPYELLVPVANHDELTTENRLHEETENTFSYVGLYPYASGNIVINKVAFTGGDYNIFGYTVGDDFYEFYEALSNKGYWSDVYSVDFHYYPMVQDCNCNMISKGVVHIGVAYDESNIIKELRVIISDCPGNMLDY